MANVPGQNFLVQPQKAWFDDHSCVRNNKSNIRTALGLPPQVAWKTKEQKNPYDGKQQNDKPSDILST